MSHVWVLFQLNSFRSVKGYCCFPFTFSDKLNVKSLPHKVICKSFNEHWLHFKCDLFQLSILILKYHLVS